MNPIKFIAGGIVTLLACVIFLMTYFTVAGNERAVVSHWGEFGYVAEPGLHFKTPFRDNVTDYPTGIESIWSGKDWVNTYTVDNQEVDIAYTIFYRIPPDKVEFLFNNNRDYVARLTSMAVDRLKAAMGQVNVQMVAEKRGELRDSIKVTLERDAKSLGLEVTDFQLTDLKYTDAFRAAVNNAAVQKANIESFEYQRQQAEKSALTAKIQAEGNANAVIAAAKGEADARVLNAKASADSRLLQATAEAKAIQLQGEAQATAIKAQAEALKANDTLVEMKKAERWNGALPTSIYAGAPIPFMNAGSK